MRFNMRVPKNMPVLSVCFYTQKPPVIFLLSMHLKGITRLHVR